MGIGRYFIVLGTDHRLQGAEKRLEPPNINDPSYSALVRDTVSFHSVDFVFEEASMKGPTTAKRIADELNIPYCDVDLDEKTRGEAGMEGSTGQIIAPEYLTKNDRPEHGSVRSHRISAQMQREEYWVNQIQSKPDFQNGLLVCGYMHLLSMGTRLAGCGFCVTAWSYLPSLVQTQSTTRGAVAAGIIEKLRAEIDRGITTESQVVYLLASARKILERNSTLSFPVLKFHCDWVLHSRLSGPQAREMVTRLKPAHEHFVAGKDVHELPTGVRKELDRISQLIDFRKELSNFLASQNLPTTVCDPDSWTRFLFLYCQIIENAPLELVGDPELSRVFVTLQIAHTQPVLGMVLYQVSWRFRDAEDKGGEYFVINSYDEYRPAPDS
jgi:hypothetical protein